MSTDPPPGWQHPGFQQPPPPSPPEHPSPGWQQPPPGYPSPGWQQPSPGWQAPQPPPAPRKSWPARHKAWTSVFAVVGVLVVLGIIGAIVGPPKSQPASRTQAAASTTAPAAAATSAAPTPAPVPSPNGTFQGSCDYTLTNNIYGNDHLIGEVDLTNTGNIGTVVRVRITWPQEGYAPITARKTVRTKPGTTTPVRFHIPVSSSGNVINQLQSWQLSHNDRTGCTYDAKVVRTFGSAH